jgi:hypothetical protein
MSQPRSLKIYVAARGHNRPTEILRDEVRRMVAGGARLVEVLPAKEYEAEHLPGAIKTVGKHLCNFPEELLYH